MQNTVELTSRTCTVTFLCDTGFYTIYFSQIMNSREKIVKVMHAFLFRIGILTPGFGAEFYINFLNDPNRSAAFPLDHIIATHCLLCILAVADR